MTKNLMVTFAVSVEIHTCLQQVRHTCVSSCDITNQQFLYLQPQDQPRARCRTWVAIRRRRQEAAMGGMRRRRWSLVEDEEGSINAERRRLGLGEPMAKPSPRRGGRVGVGGGVREGDDIESDGDVGSGGDIYPGLSSTNTSTDAASHPEPQRERERAWLERGREGGEGTMEGSVLVADRPSHPQEEASHGELDILTALDLLGEGTASKAAATGVIKTSEAGAGDKAEAAAAASDGEKVEAGKKTTKTVLLPGEEVKRILAGAPRRGSCITDATKFARLPERTRNNLAAVRKELDDFYANIREQYNRHGCALVSVDEYEY